MGQTAVELLEDGINKVLSHLPLEREDIKTLIQQAKAMEKVQIIEAMDRMGNTDFYCEFDSPEQYYNKTFKSE